MNQIIDGTNFDDLKEYRPGIKALQELGIKSLLVDTKTSKEQVREIAKELGISVSSVKTLKSNSVKKLSKILPNNLLLTIVNLI